MAKGGENGAKQDSILGRIVDVFLQGDLAPMLILLSLVGGAIALYATPREEEPQIVVPLADVLVAAPGPSGVASFTTDPAEGARVTVSDIDQIWTSDPGWQWEPSDQRVDFTTDAFATDLVMVGPASVETITRPGGLRPLKKLT